MFPRLEMEFFHERVLHRFGSIPRNGTGVMRDEFVLAIVTGVGDRNGVGGLFYPRQGIPEAFPPVARQQECKFLTTGVVIGLGFFCLCFEAIAFPCEPFVLFVDVEM